MSRSRLSTSLHRALAAGLLAATLSACSSSPPPTLADVKKLEAEDRTFDALQTLIPMAQGGDPAAQYELAGFYHYGYVGSADFAKALKWYRASARQGYADAMVGLSVMYLGGQGVAKDPREAFVWLNLAAQYMTDKQALAKIKRIRSEIGRNFTKDDIAYAKAESLLLAPETSSVQPNEAESIDHLPDQLPPETMSTTTAPASTVPLQNVPPETAPLSDIPLQNALPAPPSKPLTVPSTALPATTSATTALPAAPATTGLPATTVTQPAPTLPTTTAPTTSVPIVPPASTEAPPPPTDAPSSTQQIQSIPSF